MTAPAAAQKQTAGVARGQVRSLSQPSRAGEAGGVGCRHVGIWRFLGVTWTARPGDLLMDWVPRSLKDAAGVPGVWAG